MRNRVFRPSFRVSKCAFFAAILLQACFSFVGCVSSDKAGSDEMAVIELKGNPTTGYLWSYTIADESVISVSEESEYLGKGNVVGAPSMFYYMIHPLAPGETTVTFVYKRPWENTEADTVKTYRVTVSRDGKVFVEGE